MTSVLLSKSHHDCLGQTGQTGQTGLTKTLQN